MFTQKEKGDEEVRIRDRPPAEEIFVRQRKRHPIGRPTRRNHDSGYDSLHPTTSGGYTAHSLGPLFFLAMVITLCGRPSQPPAGDASYAVM